jgi:hypothetical protein
MELPNGLLNLLRHRLYFPSPLNAISYVSICSSRILRTVLDIFLDQVRGVSRSQRCSSSEVSCLLSRRYHNHWRTSPASVSSTSRVGSCRMVFITRFPLIYVRWMGVVNHGKLCGPTPIHPTRILLASPSQNERVLTPDTTRR